MSTFDPSMYPPPGYETWGRLEWFWFCGYKPDSPACVDMPSFFGSVAILPMTNPTLLTLPRYRINLAANVAFVSIFSLSALLYILTYAFTRRGLSFFVAMLLGVLCEVFGYAGRIIAYENQWIDKGFLMQICCLTIGPAFLAAGIYLSLRKIVYAFGAENSRIRPEWYTRIVRPLPLSPRLLPGLPD